MSRIRRSVSGWLVLALGQAVVFSGCQSLFWRDAGAANVPKVVVDGQEPAAELLGQVRAVDAGLPVRSAPQRVAQVETPPPVRAVSARVTVPSGAVVAAQSRATPAISRIPAVQNAPPVSSDWTPTVSPAVSPVALTGGQQLGAMVEESAFTGSRIRGVGVMGVSKDAFGAAVALLKFATGESLVVRLGQAITVPIDGSEHSLFVVTIGARNIVLRDASTNKLWEAR